MAVDRSDDVVAQWREQRPDLDPSPMATFTRLWRAARIADERLLAVFARHDLEAGWFDVLATLRRAGAPHRLSAGTLARGLVMSTGGMTKRLDKLVAAGLVERTPDPDDRRGVLVSLTARGLETVDRAVEDHVANEARLLSALSEREVKALNGALAKLLASWA
ncbi:Multiple antibiotic resistance protein MarR [Baekduia alba]|uniref:MarR family winged helix-turn-helix transcriptional regulator n=1 Tax=Baekduia alba TaxID=2997333 RepID=UPI002341562A|nr:MarR family transcriptional regulator [Baekduia alba]WCB94616.1 Multiple antibiotic resistance protein MarR [Baekduia alba]